MRNSADIEINSLRPVLESVTLQNRNRYDSKAEMRVVQPRAMEIDRFSSFFPTIPPLSGKNGPRRRDRIIDRRGHPISERVSNRSLHTLVLALQQTSLE